MRRRRAGAGAAAGSNSLAPHRPTALYIFLVDVYRKYTGLRENDCTAQSQAGTGSRWWGLCGAVSDCHFAAQLNHFNLLNHFYARFPIIFSRYFSKATIGCNPRFVGLEAGRVALARGGTTILAAQLAVHNDGACLALTSARVDLRCSRALSCPAWTLSAAEGNDSSGSRMAVHTPKE